MSVKCRNWETEHYNFVLEIRVTRLHSADTVSSQSLKSFVFLSYSGSIIQEVCILYTVNIIESLV
jgi:hypothetical protein